MKLRLIVIDIYWQNLINMKKIIIVLVTFISLYSHAQKLSVFTAANGKKGLKDENGKIVAPANYSSIDEFNNGMAAVKVGSKYGYINRKGVLVIQPQYDSAGMFFLYSARVVKGKERFLIDTDGNKKDNIFSDLTFQLDLNKLNTKQINWRCDRFSNGTYNGETSWGEPNGYGMYLFGDSSFYCGTFSGKDVSGTGVFYDKSENSVSIGKWSSGRLTGDYFVLKLGEYKLRVYTALTNGSVLRAEMKINGRYVITGNMLQAFTEKRHNLVNILDETGISTMYAAVNSDENIDGRYVSFDSRKEVIQVNNSKNGDYLNNESSQSYSNSSAISDAEEAIGFKIPGILYPQKLLIDNSTTQRYFGKAEGNTPRGFGSLSINDQNNHLLTAMFNGDQINGFKEEIFNEEQKSIYAGDFMERVENNIVVHTGTYAKCVYNDPNSVAIDLGSFKDENSEEVLVNGISMDIGPNIAAITFVNNEAGQSNGKGFLMLPLKNTFYRGSFDENEAHGFGEVSTKSGVQKAHYAHGKYVGVVDKAQTWHPLLSFTGLFDKPFALIDEK